MVRDTVPQIIPNPLLVPLCSHPLHDSLFLQSNPSLPTFSSPDPPHTLAPYIQSPYLPTKTVTFLRQGTAYWLFSIFYASGRMPDIYHRHLMS